MAARNLQLSAWYAQLPIQLWQHAPDCHVLLLRHSAPVWDGQLVLSGLIGSVPLPYDEAAMEDYATHMLVFVKPSAGASAFRLSEALMRPWASLAQFIGEVVLPLTEHSTNAHSRNAHSLIVAADSDRECESVRTASAAAACNCRSITSTSRLSRAQQSRPALSIDTNTSACACSEHFTFTECRLCVISTSCAIIVVAYSSRSISVPYLCLHRPMRS